MNQNQNPAIGDEVFIVTPGSWENSYKLAKVSAVTKTTIKVQYDHSGFTGILECTFSIKSGYEYGHADSYRAKHLNWKVEELKKILSEKAKQEAGFTAINLAAGALSQISSRSDAETQLDAIAAARARLDEAEKALRA